VGIVDVAIGVSGLMPIDDLRGTPDADGRIMRSTIRATADEIATAAELALADGPATAAIVRERTHAREGRIADVLMRPSSISSSDATGGETEAPLEASFATRGRSSCDRLYRRCGSSPRRKTSPSAARQIAAGIDRVRNRAEAQG